MVAHLRIAVTGGTGFVGARLIAALQAAGHDVRALTRRPQQDAEGVTWIAGSLEDQSALDRLAEGADALIHVARDAGFEPDLLDAVRGRNAQQKHVLVNKITRHFGDDLSGRIFALWGLAFKPETDDMRDAPSRVIMEALWERGAVVRAYDPEAMDECRRLYGERNNLELVTSRDAALQGADALIIATEWKAFRSVDFGALKSALRSPAIFDGRNVLDPATARDAGFSYYGIGR